MFKFVLVLTLSMLSIEATIPSETEAKIVEYKNDNDGLGNYFFRYVTSNGITRQETSRLINSGQSDEHIAVEGYYSYKDLEGLLHTVYYKADTNGYKTSTTSKPRLDDGFLEPPIPGVPDSVVASLLGK
ncbi:PREDICTED: endocuticle structural glycoprotein SgAbd-5-like [Papilio polytes]|uniref:endocuticle structural glycoprotein SgAbd-5-like n=1 Tax=Papilio polytes TaxID=76194 RepID=UPI0006765E80|nr:PREDICTED: endocuticle structural glycoprotein SgAbd-5-like [Papilio polytes]XP_013141192.1 PREDICTED: endocuticle structural glycoprotein SgAbd-5-like [Papilio polytes]